MINNCNLIGNVGQEPKVKNFDNGGKVAQFSVAVTQRGYTTADGKVIEDNTTWVPCVAFSGLAGIIEKYVQKGSKVGISGSLRSREWKDDSDNKRTVLEVVVSDLELLTPKQNSDNSSTPTNNVKSTTVTTNNVKINTNTNVDTEDDELPF